MKINPHRYVYLDQTDGEVPVPAGGGGDSAPKTPSSDVDWVGESDPVDDNVPATPSEPTPAAPVAAPATPAPSAPAPSAPAPVPAPAAATPPVPAPAAPAPATPVPATPVAAPVVEAPQPPAPTPPAQPDLAALRTAEVTRLTGVMAGRLTEEVARGLLVEPEKHLPALLAQAQVDTMDAVMQHIYGSLPQLIQNLTQQSTHAQAAEQEFYSAWPALNNPANPQFKQVVESAIRTYRTLNPKAPKEEIVRAAGLQAMITLRLPLPAELFAPQPPAAPATPPSFAHAAPSAAAPVPAAPGSNSNPFVLLNQEFDHEERG